MGRLFLHSQLLVGFCCGLLLLTPGCASTGKTTVSQPFTVKLGQFNSARVEIKSPLQDPQGRLREFMVQLESRIIAKLRDTNAFGKIYSGADTDSPAQLRVMVTITSVRDLNNYDRVMWGAMAGQAKSRASVEVWDLAADKRLGACDIEGKSSGGSVFAGTTPQAVDRAADEVVRFITENL